MTTDKGVWNLQQVRDKQLQSLWSYSTTSNEAWTWGENTYGELGQNNRTNYSSPKQIPGTNWARVGVRGNQVAGVKSDGTLWTWGRNDSGMLGHNDTNHRSSPVQLPGTTWSSDWGKITGTSYAMMGAVKTDGSMWTWGNNAKGQLGQNNTTTYSSPKQIPGTTWSTIHSAGYSMIATKTDGTLWSWGYNDDGQLGLNNRSYYSSPTQIPGTTWDTNINSFGGNYNCSMAIKTDGTLWSWGYNFLGALGQNQAMPVRYSSPVQVPGTTWSQIIPTGQGSMALKTDGTIWGWGTNVGGALGQNNETQYSSPVQIGDQTNWVSISTGHQAKAAINTSGQLWVWGDNEEGNLGQNNLTQYSSPIQIPGTNWAHCNIGDGEKRCLATKTDGTLWTWGDGMQGQMGNSTAGNPAHYSSPVQIPGTTWNTTRQGITNNSYEQYALKS